MSTNGTNEGPKVVKVSAEMVPASSEIPINEIEAQIAAAHRHPRSVTKFLVAAKEMACLTEDVAESCLYRLKRWDPEKQMEVPLIGGSIRLAEICLSAWGNCHAGARPGEIGQREVKGQGVCWDVERNVRVTMETIRGITKKNGDRYKNDLILVTMNAASAIALRNAIFKIIPAALIEEVLEAAKKASVGEVSSKRAKVIQRLGKYGATVERILASLGRKAIEEITIEDLQVLIASGSTLKNGDQTVDELFPPIAKPEASGAAAATPAVSTPAASTTTPTATPAAAATTTTPAATSTPAAATPKPTSGPRQTGLAAVAARGRATKPTDDGGLIGGPTHLTSVPAATPEDPEDAANRAAAAPTDSEMPEWAR